MYYEIFIINYAYTINCKQFIVIIFQLYLEVL